MKINQFLYSAAIILILLAVSPNTTLFAQMSLNLSNEILYSYVININVFKPFRLYCFLSNYNDMINQNNNTVESIYSTSFYYYTISTLSNYNRNNIITSVLEEENEKEESIFRRVEILFFISIPFIYIYINLLINLQNSMLGNSGEKYTDGQTFFMLTTIVLFGLEVIITDSKKDS